MIRWLGIVLGTLRSSVRTHREWRSRTSHCGGNLPCGKRASRGHSWRLRIESSSLKRFVKSTARGSFQLLLSLLLLDENDRRACGRARCARFVILLFALSVASGDSPAHD